MSFRKSIRKTPRCPKCKRRVYFREQVIALGHNWYSFLSPNVALGICDRNDKLYCQPCYQRAFGARGFRGTSFGSMRFGTLDLDSDPEPQDKKRKTEMTTGTKFELSLEDYEEMAEKASIEADEGATKLSRPISSESFGLRKGPRRKPKTEEVEIPIEEENEDLLPIPTPTIIPPPQRPLQARENQNNMTRTPTLSENPELSEASAAFVASAKVLIDVVTVALSDPETRRAIGETMSKLLRKADE